MTLSGKSSLILGENKAAFQRKGHNFGVTSKWYPLPLCQECACSRLEPLSRYVFLACILGENTRDFALENLQELFLSDMMMEY